MHVLATGTAESADAAIDATGAIAHIAGRTHATEATTALCALVRDSRALVRANALAGLALDGARCGDGQLERSLLGDPSESVRAAAARALSRTPRGSADTAALERCAGSERSAEVAHLCEHIPPPSVGTPHATLAYVETMSSPEPRVRGAYVVEMGDGVLRAGAADRRGAFFDPVAPPGYLRLHHPGSTPP